MNLQTAKGLKKGDHVHHTSRKNADGTPMRAQVTSVKTWKTRPEMVEVHVKHGLYDFAVFLESDLDQIEIGDGL